MPLRPPSHSVAPQSATRELIDTSFRKLRSAEGACDLLQNFKSIKSKGAIQKQVINKFNDILEQFSREIDTTAQLFAEHKERPPVTKNQPPVAGAIKWARALLARTKQTMQKLQRTEDDIIRTTGEPVTHLATLPCLRSPGSGVCVWIGRDNGCVAALKVAYDCGWESWSSHGV
jgi:histone H3/H4